MQHDDLILVEDMLVEVRDARAFVQGLEKSDFLRDRLVGKAVAHCLQTIGEAASRLSAEFRMAHAEVSWEEIIGLRHRLVHGYRTVSYDIVWGVVVDELPGLEESLVGILGDAG